MDYLTGAHFPQLLSTYSTQITEALRAFFSTDLDLVKECGFDSYRFSTSWTRVMPNGRKSDEQSLAFCDRLIDAMCEHGLKAQLTLYHWDLPSELADIGGWMNRETPQRFADYSKAVIEKLDDRLTSVATINEPWCVAWLSYFLGHHARGLRDVRGATRRCIIFY